LLVKPPIIVGNATHIVDIPLIYVHITTSDKVLCI